MPFDIIVRDECLAVKAWRIEDVQKALKDKGYEGTLEQAEIVTIYFDCDILADCTDGDWEIIYGGIEDAAKELDKLTNRPES